MLFLVTVIRGVLSVGVALLVLLVASLGAAPVVEAPSHTPPSQLATTSVKTSVATTTLAIATTTPRVTTTVATTTPSKPVSKPVPKPQPKVEDLKITLNQAIQSIQDLALSSTTEPVNQRVRSALVNIICTTAASGPFESISASGVIIDPRGIIVTNAHAAQFFLLKDYPTPGFVKCIIRTGSPAQPAYTAEPIFIPPSWVAKNAQKIIDENPTGNGEHDYAFLRITGPVSPGIQMPAAFPFVLTALNEAPQGTDVLVAGYAAGFLGGITVAKELYAASAYSKVSQIYTYGTSTADLYSVGGTIVAQRGSSGGAVTTTDGTLIGVIVTSTVATETANRDLRAIGSAYIIRDFEAERGKSLQSVLSGDIAAEAEIFSKLYAPAEKQLLVDILEQ